jgi:hypothetical protein
MPAVTSERPTGPQHDLAHTPSVLLLWGAPTAVAILASTLVNNHAISVTLAGALWTASTLWIGVGCVINGKHCGRVHCRIDGVMFPLLGLVGLFNVIGLVSFSWNAYWAVFGVILVGGFLPEFFWRKYA